MALWLVIAVMTAIAAACVAGPLLRRRPADRPRAEYDVALYRDQLAEIERDATQGLLSGQEAAAARTEVARRLLAASEKTPAAVEPSNASRNGPSRRTGLAWPTAAIVGIAAPVLALAIYLTHGAPGLPGQSASERIATRPQPSDQQSTGPMTARDPRDEALVAELARRMQERPDDPKGWALLGRSLLSLGRAAEAAEAYAKAAALLPAEADLHARLGEARMQAADGQVTSAARQAFETASNVDPREPRSRYYLGLAELQAGNERAALDLWLALEADSPADAPWRQQLAARIENLADRLGVDLGSARRDRGTAPPRGPSAADVATAQSMAPEQRMAMIRSMVESLANRLESEPNDVEGWMRLGRSYAVLEETARSRDAYARAAQLRPEDPAVQSAYAESLFRSAGDGTLPAELTGVLQRMLAHDPNDHNALWLSGLAAVRRGENVAARSHWSKLLAQLSPGSPEHTALKQRVDSLSTN